MLLTKVVIALKKKRRYYTVEKREKILEFEIIRVAISGVASSERLKNDRKTKMDLKPVGIGLNHR